MSEDRSIRPEFLKERAEEFRKDSFGRIVQNAVSAQDADAVSTDRDIINRLDDSVSERLDSWTVTDQKRSGRCWAFAGLNVLRARMMKELNLESFEFSENFVAFHDKLEKANHALALAIETVAQPAEDEDVRNLFEPNGDGGYWPQFMDLVAKYGLVPVWAMPDTEAAGNTLQMNRALSTIQRRAITKIRAAHAAGSQTSELEAIREAAMKDVWRVLAIHLGTPPASFTWQYRDKDKNFHAEGEMTPRQFAAAYVPADLGDYATLAHDPREENPAGRLYSQAHTPLMEGGTVYTHVSAPIEDLKRAAIGAIRDGEPVWFGCDVKRQFDKDAGIWDAKLHDYEGLYGVALDMSKAERMRAHETAVSHAMTLVGVDLVDGEPKRWRVENSWGEKVGTKGFFTMDDSWFDEYVFEVIVAPRRLTDAQRHALTEEPIELPDWDVF